MGWGASWVRAQGHAGRPQDLPRAVSTGRTQGTDAARHHRPAWGAGRQALRSAYPWGAAQWAVTWFRFAAQNGHSH